MDLGNLMKEAQKLQQSMENAQKALAELKQIGKSGGNLVQVEMTGTHTLTRVEINPRLMDEDIEMLQDLVLAAVNDASQKLLKASQARMSEFTAGLNLPTEFLKKDGEEK